MSDFLLDPAITFLNHGSFGACPQPVLDAQQAYRTRLERRPVQFLIRELEAELHAVRGQIGALIGASADDLAFVRNATSGVNAVMSSLTLGPGDRILTTSHRYHAVGNTLTHTCRRTGASLDVVDIPFPLADPGEVTARLADAITAQTRLLVIDHIASKTALVFPVAEIAAEARRRGVPVLIDGAHAPGHIEVDLAAIGADYWVGNLHKWPCAPKGAAVLWVAPHARQALHPTVISLRYGEGLQREFDWCGTDDPTPWLASGAALHYHERLGGKAFRAANIALSRAATERLCDRLDLTPGADHPALRCAMSTMRLPAPAEDADRIFHALLARNIESFIHPFDGSTIVRLSAFSAYNHIGQYDALAEALAEVLGR